MLFFFLLFYLYITFYEVCSREQMEVRPTGKGCIEIEVPYFNFSLGGVGVVPSDFSSPLIGK